MSKFNSFKHITVSWLAMYNWHLFSVKPTALV